jgi:hypothetical protein
MGSEPGITIFVPRGIATDVNSGTAGKRSGGNTLLMMLMLGLCVGVWFL